MRLLLSLVIAGRLSAQIFFPAVNVPVGRAPAAVITGDFNGDGQADIVVSNSGSSSITVLVGKGNGVFGTRRDIASASQPRALASGDFNADGNLDLAVVDGGGDFVSILLGNGDGTFRVPIPTLVSGPTALVVGDFNADGRLDLAVTSGSSNSVQILLGFGNGTFFAANSFETGINPVALALADFNFDGRPDLAVANGGSASITILLGDGHGGFLRSSDVYTGTSAVSIAAGDLNNDGRTDLAVLASTGAASPVVVLLGHGDATFDEGLRFTVGGSPLAFPIPVVGAFSAGLITIADLDHDGTPDLAVALGGNDSVSVLAGIGDGTFRPFANFAAGAGPSGVAAADLNGDGQLDLVVSNLAGDSVSVLVNLTPQLRRPIFTQTSVVNGASFVGGPVVAGEIIVIRGTNLGPDQLIASSSLPTTLAGTQVMIGGVAAPLLYVSSTQIGAVVPFETAGLLNVVVRISSDAGSSNIVVLPVGRAAPGLFSTDASGAGQGVALNQEGSANNGSNPAAVGSVVTLFGTGGGQLRNVRVTIGSFAADVIDVTNGPAEGLFGVRARIPAQVRTGDVPVVVTVDTFSTQAGLTIRVE
jgi:uncharacterized protein (TIGR03437 family)